MQASNRKLMVLQEIDEIFNSAGNAGTGWKLMICIRLERFFEPQYYVTKRNSKLHCEMRTNPFSFGTFLARARVECTDHEVDERHARFL